MDKPELNLTGVYAKLYRAEEHFKAIDAEIAAWVNSGKYEPFFERNHKQTRIAASVVHIGPPADLIRWSVMIGDCINNLRMALDHLMNAFCKVSYIYKPSGKKERISFIIIDDPDAFDKALRESYSGLSLIYRAVLRDLQPFARKHPILPPLLSIIRDLSNADKHHLLQVAGAGVAKLGGDFIADPTRGSKTTYINPDPIEHNDAICVIESSEPDPNLRFTRLEVGVEISLWHSLREGATNPLEARSGVTALLPMLIEEVRTVIKRFTMAA